MGMYAFLHQARTGKTLPLCTRALSATSANGWRAIPGKAGQNLTLAGQDFERYRDKPWNASDIRFELEVSEFTENGGVQAGLTRKQAVLKNLERFQRFATSDGLILEVQNEFGDSRYADAVELTGGTVMDPIGDWQHAFKVTGTFHLPSGFWRGPDLITDTAYFTDDPAPLVNFALMTAPVFWWTMEWVGPLVNPILTDVVSNKFLKYNGTIGSGETITFDTRTRAGDGGDIRLFTGNGRVPFRLNPAADEDGPLYTLHTGGAGHVNLSAYPRFVAP